MAYSILFFSVRYVMTTFLSEETLFHGSTQERYVVESLVIFSHMMGINPLKPIVESGSRLLAQISREI